MRRCGKRYTAPEDAWRSKAGQRPDAEVTDCRAGCGGFHVVKPPRPPRARRRPKGAHSFPPAVAKQLAARDPWCVYCGSTRGLQNHHRRLKGIGGDSRDCTQCACNGVRLCSDHHAWAHSGAGRPVAEAEGLIIPRSVTEPWRHGVMVHSEADSGATRWPTCDGEYADERPELEAA